MRLSESINKTITKLMEGDENIFVVGEDILDPYGGAFKVTKGLSLKFPDRVITTPISEASIVGFASGMAMHRKKVIVEIMFGDFLGLAFDQILNHIAKFRWLFNNVEIPLIIRTPMGGGRGYGATHSQSIEKHFCGISGLKVIAINQYTDIEKIYTEALYSKNPTLIIENKILYGKQLQPKFNFKKNNLPDMICISYGGSIEVCLDAAQKIFDEEEIIVEILPIEELSPFNDFNIMKASERCKKFIIVEEAGGGWGFIETCKSSLAGIDGLQFETIRGPDHPIPSTKKWEQKLLPNRDLLISKMKKIFNN
jgi:pyruvate/2-oxoglutarate/acetoin dehydrogenase E1 component